MWIGMIKAMPCSVSRLKIKMVSRYCIFMSLKLMEMNKGYVDFWQFLFHKSDKS